MYFIHKLSELILRLYYFQSDTKILIFGFKIYRKIRSHHINIEVYGRSMQLIKYKFNVVKDQTKLLLRLIILMKPSERCSDERCLMFRVPSEVKNVQVWYKLFLII